MGAGGDMLEFGGRQVRLIEEAGCGAERRVLEASIRRTIAYSIFRGLWGVADYCQLLGIWLVGLSMK